MGGSTAKNDRIRRLIPLFEQGRMYIPYKLMKMNYERINQDLIPIFVNDEFRAFPVAVHDDMLDCLARIIDEKLNAEWPVKYGNLRALPERQATADGFYF